MLDQKNLLDLRNDAVFKLYFSKESNRPILISFLEAVIEPSVPIESVTLLNPTLPKILIEEKQSVLDLLIHLANGTQIDVEMQVARTDGFRRRVLYYWAKLHHAQLKNGESYRKLAPTFSICVLDYTEFPEWPDQIHSIFELRERNSGALYLPDMELHFLELSKYLKLKEKIDPIQPRLAAWSQFFLSTEIDPKDLEKLTQKEPIMSKALKALEELSQDEEARQLADAREKHRINLHIITTEAEARGEAMGIAKTKKEHILKAAKAGLEPEKIAAIFDVSLEEVTEALRNS